MADDLDKEKLENDSKNASNFVLRIEEVIEKIDMKQINGVRGKLIAY